MNTNELKQNETENSDKNPILPFLYPEPDFFPNLSLRFGIDLAGVFYH